MQSALLLGTIGVLIGAPGTAAALLALPPGTTGIVTRCAAVFGLGFAVAGGCAFTLATTHLFWLASYLPLWLAVTAVLWAITWRRASPRTQLRALAPEFSQHRIALLLGAIVILALLLVWAQYLNNLPGPRYVYILNGVEIANSHGIPARVLEYGQAWPPATDKVFLDAFTGVLVMFDNNPLVIPGVLLWVAYAGAAVGLWASAWELGLRRTGILLPVLMLGNTQLPGMAMTDGFTFYRAEDFGIAVAVCALALGVSAIRTGGRGRALAAAIVLAAASGSHLVPVVIVTAMLGAVLLAELVRRRRARAAKATARDALVLASCAAALGLLIRLVAGGSFGLTGADNQASYAVVHTSFDPTAFMSNGSFITRTPVESSHFYLSPGLVIESVMQAATNIHMTWGPALIVLAVGLVIAIAFLIVRTEFAAAACAGVTVLVVVNALGLYFSYRYHVWIEATFGIRRPTLYVPIGSSLVVLTLVEVGLARLHRVRWRPVAWSALPIPAVLVVAAAVWLLPTAGPDSGNRQRSRAQQQFATWVRTRTSCGARFLLDQRSEGAVAALTGRFALDEGMGAFLRPDRLQRVTDVLLAARRFYLDPAANEAVLRRYDINYVVFARSAFLGYWGPIPSGSVSALRAAPFLVLVKRTPSFQIYAVKGSRTRPVAPLLRGPYLRCRRSPATF